MEHHRTARILVLASIVLTSSFLSAQEFVNLQFDQRCDTSKTGLCSWELAWGAKNSCSPAIVDGNNVLLIDVKSGVGWAEQAMTIEPTEDILVISISARIKTEHVKEKGAGLNIGIYDKDGGLIVSKDSGNYGEYGWVINTTSWQCRTVDVVAPEGSSTIKIGGILYGPGKVWYDDFKIVFRPAVNGNISALAREYVGNAMDTAALHSLRKDSVDLSMIRQNALQIAGDAQS